MLNTRSPPGHHRVVHAADAALLSQGRARVAAWRRPALRRRIRPPAREWPARRARCCPGGARQHAALHGEWVPAAAAASFCADAIVGVGAH